MPTADTTLAPCGDCGMPCNPAEYHPYAACLMFKACHNSDTVRANLEAVRAQAPAPQRPALAPLTDEQIAAIWVEHGLDDCDPEGFARHIEAAHAITGATNGKESA